MIPAKIHRTIIQLKARDYITPNYIRLSFTGKDIAAFQQCTIGANNKIFIPPIGEQQVHFQNPEKEPQIPASQLAIRRTYTHVGIDMEKQEMYMDFVAHGVEGPASNFAIHAKIGDSIGVAMKLQKTELVPVASNYYIVGDGTSMPVIQAILASLMPDAKGHVFLEVPTQEDKQNLTKPKDIHIHWLVNTKTQEETTLADKAIAYLNTMNIESSSKFAFVACEYANVKKMRSYFRKEKKWAREELSAYSYWKFGAAETKSEEERRGVLNELCHSILSYH